ncbi:hypothetical protein SJI00_17115 [Pseudomonas sp. RP23018S]|uniref:hypothetical protein n=1 Tax=Pseudomonas sp. RP23018S TaxID=3096037 RepID=UPI002ACA631A|nr:hypothetical protein [Pseudomonas sp. RP23018S]MDZ5604494.1 hypothetical protein [Pseudomonas sp. RP23018S]
MRKTTWAGALALLVSGCATSDLQTPPSTRLAGPIQPVRPTSIDTRLYQQDVGDYKIAPLQRTLRNDGYLVESGLLTGTHDTPAGALVMVRSPSGALTAIIDRPGKRGLLLVDALGKRRFLAEPDYDYLKSDMLAAPMPAAETPAQPSASTSANSGIDVLVTFSTQALDVLASDPVAFALAQLQTVNSGLRNSDIGNITLDLAGIVVTAQDRGVDSPGLRATQNAMDALRSDYRHDVNAAYYVKGDYAGLAYLPGWSSVNSIHYPLAFRHELGHNVGGGHCYPEAGDNYKHGHKVDSDRSTHLCGNQLPYYSTPAVRLDGVALGHPATADMARLWKEQAGRLKGYSPAFDGERMIVLSGQGEQRLRVTTKPTSTRSGVVAHSTEIGPMQLTASRYPLTTLRVPLKAENGQTYTVNLSAQKEAGNCGRTIMNSTSICHPDFRGAFDLLLNYDPAQNPHLPTGWYNGVLELEAIDSNDPSWSRPILVSLSVRS